MKKVKVIIDKFGAYKKGDVLTMPKSTADGCIQSGVVEAVSKAKK